MAEISASTTHGDVWLCDKTIVRAIRARFHFPPSGTVPKSEVMGLLVREGIEIHLMYDLWAAEAQAEALQEHRGEREGRGSSIPLGVWDRWRHRTFLDISRI